MNRADKLNFLKCNAPFSHLPEADQDWLADHLEAGEVGTGEILLHPSQQPEHLIFVVAGQIRIEAVGLAIPEERRLIAEILPGECFPVEALHEIRPVFSTYRAAADLQVLRLPAEGFAELKTRNAQFQQYCNDRATAFLGSSKRIFEAHFGRRSDNAVSLEAPLRSLRLPQPDCCGPETPILEAAKTLGASGELEIVVIDAQRHPLGTFSLHDLVQRVLLPEVSLQAPIAQVMCTDLITLPLEANGYEAAQAMADHGIRQILVVDRGALQGAITERDLFAAQHMSLGQLSARIRDAQTIDELSVLAGENWTQAKRLMEQGLAAEPLTRIISSLNDRLNDRILTICRDQESEPLPDFCWIALGSEGRHEQTLSTDQDNGIIFADSDDNEAVRQRLLSFAQRANNSLAACGIPLCKGNIMAGNPQWCLSLTEWKKQFGSWIERPDSDGILNATIFFDLRALYGNHSLVDQLKDWLIKALNDQNRFFHNLSAEGLKRNPPLGIFRDFVVDDHEEFPGTIDLKLYGITMFVDAARVLGLRSGCKESGTGDRLRHAAKHMRMNQDEAEAWVAAFHFIQMLRLRNQYELSEAGQKPHNRLDPYKLNDMDKKVLIESLKQAKRLQKKLEMMTGQ